MKHYDVIIIGAGAAGLMCAATAAKRGQSVLLLDHAKSVGDKIRISGGGRCNFTNLDVRPHHFLSKNPHFCVSALKRFTQHDFIALVKKHGIAFHEKTLGQLFCDISAKQIIAMLLKECEEGGVEIRLNTPVLAVKKGFEVMLESQTLTCQSLVLATGGLSIPKMGATDFTYQIARQFGLNMIAPQPALVPFTLDDTLLSQTKELAGVSTEIIASCGKTSFREAMLFTHRGLSGPAILQISSFWEEGKTISINFAPDIDIAQHIYEEKKRNPKQEIKQLLATFLPKKLAAFLAQKANHSGNLADLSNQKITAIATLIHAFDIIPNGTEGFAKAEVTKGGVDTNDISSKTFEAKSVPGLFIIGEALDVTGWLGGFNFQWAWSSGHAAGESV